MAIFGLTLYTLLMFYEGIKSYCVRVKIVNLTVLKGWEVFTYYLKVIPYLAAMLLKWLIS